MDGMSSFSETANLKKRRFTLSLGPAPAGIEGKV